MLIHVTDMNVLQYHEIHIATVEFRLMTSTCEVSDCLHTSTKGMTILYPYEAIRALHNIERSYTYLFTSRAAAASL